MMRVYFGGEPLLAVGQVDGLDVVDVFGEGVQVLVGRGVVA